MKIAKNIHLIFLRKDEIIPPLFKECERKIREMHPLRNITLWDEKTQKSLNLKSYVRISNHIDN